MESLQTKLLILLLPFLLHATDSADFRHALYLMHINEIEHSITRYQELAKETGKQDYEVLTRMALLLMQKGASSEDSEVQMLTMFGAGLASSALSIEILDRGLRSMDPQIQLAALHFLSFLHDDRSDEILLKAMSSEFLSTRMEAAFQMASKKHPHTVGHIEALMNRLPSLFKPYFPSFFALMGTSEAISVLKKLLQDYDPMTRVSAILSTVQYGRDDLLPWIREKIHLQNIAEQEACALAFSLFKDTSCTRQLEALACSPIDTVRLSAYKALYLLGQTTFADEIMKMAAEKNLFAISSLAEIEDSEDLLLHLMNSDDINVRINATISLLRKRDPRSLQALREILIRDVRDLSFSPLTSLGRAHMAWKVIPSATQREKDPMIDLAISYAMREGILREALELPEADFLDVARMVFESKQNDLVPLLIILLENLRTDGATALLKDQATKIGSPLIRNYANLSLYRLKQSGPYEEHIRGWILNQDQADLICLYPLLPLKNRMESNEYILSAKETSKLLIDTYSAIASRQDEKSIDLILEAIKRGNSKNRYALAGLLIRAIE